MREYTPYTPGYPVVVSRVLSYLAFAALMLGIATPAGSGAVTDNARPVAQQTTTRLIYFGLDEEGTYEVQTNESTFETTASYEGVVSFLDTATPGEAVTVTQTGVAQGCASTPGNFGADESSNSCVRLSWATPSPDERVIRYTAYWGTSPGDHPVTMDFTRNQVVDQNGRSYYTICGFNSGTYYFVLRAYSQYDCWSDFSGEAQVTVTGQAAQPPAAPVNVTASEPDWGCADVGWDAVGDIRVTGYTVYWSSQSVAGGQASAYADSIETSSQTSLDVCGFAAGLWYIAVKTNIGGGMKSAYSQEISLTMSGIDTDPPAFSQVSPGDGATGVPRNVQIGLVVGDLKTGVELSSISMTVDGSPAAFANVGSPSGYYVIHVPGLLPANSVVTVQVSAADRAYPANQDTFSWSFETSDSIVVDDSAPVFSGISPPDGASNVAADAQVSVAVTDDFAGVDFTSIRFYVNDAEVPFTIEGNLESATLRYSNNDGFTYGQRVEVRIEVCDLVDPANCATLDDYSFTVLGAAYALLAEGAIVPDGFWANDPAKPLEVRNLPLNWTVRIFDTAGILVRKHQNVAGDGYNWTWDFTNDHGRRVARGMYLVRVTNTGGDVSQSGRFVVQSDP
jgi:hypothetical protein